MQQITNKDYDMVSELIRDFLEEMEFAPFGELPTAKNIVKELKRCKYFENGITAQQLGCAEESTQAVFILMKASQLRNSLSALWGTRRKPARLWNVIL